MNIINHIEIDDRIRNLLEEALENAGSQVNLARKLSTITYPVSPQLMWIWLNRNKYIWKSAVKRLERIVNNER
ncbi:MAG: hypothetical protein ACTSRT_03380 [Promethearchaeota archaeon]